MSHWTNRLRGDPLPWLLQDDAPAVKHLALSELLDRAPDDRELASARDAAMKSEPIASILAAQEPEGYWEKPGPGYATKYRGTVWQVIFLDQLGADGEDERVHRACEYVLSHSQSASGGFGASGVAGGGPPPSYYAIHCLNGNLLRAVIGFGWLEDSRTQRAIAWQTGLASGHGFDRSFHPDKSGSGFCCAANDKLPCAWGAVKAMLALGRIPKERRSAAVQRAIDHGAAFLLSCDPASAAYPFPARESKPSGSWFKLGFPSGYVADVLQTLEALCAIGLARDHRLGNAIEWLLSKQDEYGRWCNQYAYNGKTWVDFEPQGRPSKWVTLRACRVLKAAMG